MSKMKQPAVHPHMKPPEGATCQEAALGLSFYRACGNPAEYVVKTADPHAYYMCMACADHNVRNRNAHYVLEGEKVVMFIPLPVLEYERGMVSEGAVTGRVTHRDDTLQPSDVGVAGNWFPTNEDELVEWAERSAARLKERLTAWLLPFTKSDRSASQLARIYVAARAMAEALSESTSILQTEIQKLSNDTIPSAFERESAKSLTLDNGYRVTVSMTLRSSIRKDMKEPAYAWLRGNNLGALIVETVNASTLSAAAKHMAEENKELPEDIFHSFYQQSTSATKVTDMKKPRK